MIQTRRIGSRYEWTIPTTWETYSLETLFKIHWKAPKKYVHELRMQKLVWMNGEPARWTDRLTSGDVLSIPLFEQDLNHVAGSNQEIGVLYEDDHVIMVNKPPGVDTHPNEVHDTSTLLNGVVHHLQKQSSHPFVRHIHRLDRDTTGTVLFAKHRLAVAVLDAMLEERKIKRTYLALVHGKVTQPIGTIDKPIGRDRHHATRRRVSPSGQNAITHYQVLSYDDSKDVSLLSCQLETGRTHQIRVHLSAIGHPLAGDTLYGGKKICTRQALHAAKLSFLHPFTEEHVTCYAPFLDQPPIFKQTDPAAFL